MKTIIVTEKKTGEEAYRMDIFSDLVPPDTIAMYMMTSIHISQDPIAVFQTILNTREDSIAGKIKDIEKDHVDKFLMDFSVEVKDLASDLSKPNSVSDIFKSPNN